MEVYTASHKTCTEKVKWRIILDNDVSPDGKWKIVIENGKFKWIELTKMTGQFTIQELIEATKKIAPEIWKK